MALQGLVAAMCDLPAGFNQMLTQQIQDLARLQDKWYLEARGGFRYYETQPWYRTDVTSHVVELTLSVL